MRYARITLEFILIYLVLNLKVPEGELGAYINIIQLLTFALFLLIIAEKIAGNPEKADDQPKKVK